MTMYYQAKDYVKDRMDFDAFLLKLSNAESKEEIDAINAEVEQAEGGGYLSHSEAVRLNTIIMITYERLYWKMEALSHSEK